MSNNPVDENFYEQTLIHLFKELGYDYECGYDVERDFREPYYVEDLKKALHKLNPEDSEEVIDEAFRIITHINEDIIIK